MFPPGAALSPSGAVVMAADGRRGTILRTRVHRGFCTWCGQPVKPPRITWCSEECVEAIKRTWPETLVSLVTRRDTGKPCEVCREPVTVGEVDHRVPIVEGGHPFDLDNLRLIHERCHRGETAALAGRRAGRRRSA